jgi:subtilisin family serine protease
MKAVFLLAVVVAAVIAAPLLNADAVDRIEGRYIVVFKTGASDHQRTTHMARIRGVHAGTGVIRTQFNIGDFHGYTAQLSNESLQAVMASPEVDYIEVDQVVRVSQTCSRQQQTPSWGLERIDEREINLDGDYTYNSNNGRGVNVYIVDTGIYLGHSDYAGRVVWGINTVDQVNDDCNGHGTHVAGTVGGTLYGVAKQSTLIAVKVLNCAGSGSWEAVIGGVNYVAAQHKSNGTRPSVANMSLGGGFTAALNQAVAAAVTAGVTFVVAGGNENTDACTRSPASEPLAITVGSTAMDQFGLEPTDERSSFSNYGTCVDVWAPGSLITSAWIGGPNAVRTISGTSMASPHVAGVASAILSADPTLTPLQVEELINAKATIDAVDLLCPRTGNCLQSPNRLLYNIC